MHNPSTNKRKQLKKTQKAKPEILNYEHQRNTHELFNLTLNDIFRKFAMLVNRELSFAGFGKFCKCFERTSINQSLKRDFKKYWTSNKRIILRGLKKFLKDRIKN
jgi:hypothetical protein